MDKSALKDISGPIYAKKKGQLPVNAKKQWKAILDRKAVAKFKRSKKHMGGQTLTVGDKDDAAFDVVDAALFNTKKSNDSTRLDSPPKRSPADVPSASRHQSGEGASAPATARKRPRAEAAERASDANPSKKSKFNPFAKEMKIFEERKREQEAERAKKEAEKAARLKMLEESKTRREKERKKLTARTSRGQPVMRNIMQTVVAKLQK
eukprot:GDKH01017760.1.p1 GENE.GDKH01017760.1~~GDKH01017760.1.p1  ORF type:complete len:208 (-),score=32.35 GDKH01017760.1:118-741(-)